MAFIFGLFLTGFSASFIGGLIGLGGGFLVVPLLTLALGFDIKDAVFFSLSSILLMSLIKNIKNKKLLKKNRAIVISLAPFVIAGSASSALVGIRAPSEVIQLLFGVLLIVMSFIYYFDSLRLPSKAQGIKPLNLARFFLVIAGSLSGFFGVGGGIINVPVLHRVMKIDTKEAVRLSFAFVILSVSVAMFVILNGRREALYQIPPAHLAFMLIGTFAGAMSSEKIKISSKEIRKLFCIVIFCIGITKILKTFL